MAKTFRKLTSTSREVLSRAELFTFQSCDDGIADSWWLIWGKVGMWNHVISDSSGPITFDSLDSAVKFLRKKKIPLDSMDFINLYLGPKSSSSEGL
jgi:hypothetical protein